MNIEKVTGITAAIPSTDEQKKPAYYVFFWEKDSSPEDAPDEEKYIFYQRHAYCLQECSSVLDAIAWENAHAHGRQSATLLLAPAEENRGGTLYLLHGSYPDGMETDPPTAHDIVTGLPRG